MYSSRRNFLGYFGDVLSRSQVLNAGQKYTFTFSFPWYSQYPSSSDAIRFLGASLVGAADVIGASRSLFSSNFVVTIIPTVSSLTIEEFILAFVDAWKGSPWYVSNPEFVQAEGGTTSTAPGGIQELVSEITQPIGVTLSQGVGNVVKPMLPYILLGGGILFVIFVLPKMMRAKKLLEK